LPFRKVKAKLFGISSPDVLMRRLCLLLAALVLAGCNASSAPAFDPRAAEIINQAGKGTIEGHAFFRDEKGKVIYAAGEIIRLIPATPYADARFSQLYGSSKYRRAGLLGLTGGDPDSEYARYSRTTKAESSGRFTFENLAPGSYYVVTQITWLPDGSLVAQGGSIYERVTLSGKESEPVKVIVSGK
jgi:hypothetical protein